MNSAFKLFKRKVTCKICSQKIFSFLFKKHADLCKIQAISKKEIKNINEQIFELIENVTIEMKLEMSQNKSVYKKSSSKLDMGKVEDPLNSIQNSPYSKK